MTTIRFPLDEMGLAEVLEQFLSDNIDKVMPALSFSQTDQNDKVEIGDVTIERVRVLKTGIIEVDYQYEWSFYAGCKDISDAGLKTETIQGKLVDGHVEFDVYQPPEPRTTFEEF